MKDLHFVSRHIWTISIMENIYECHSVILDIVSCCWLYYILKVIGQAGLLSGYHLIVMYVLVCLHILISN